jgi:5-methylcytosine-specific restriction enzyme A
MTLRQKRPRLRLGPQAYEKLRREVLARDGWRCQHCGRAENLEVHHIRSRSKLGDDSSENLITLCTECHKLAHEQQALGHLPG